jgi:hypothetical protein
MVYLSSSGRRRVLAGLLLLQLFRMLPIASELIEATEVKRWLAPTTKGHIGMPPKRRK